MKMATETAFKQIEVGIIPKDWEWVKLSETVQINPKRELEKGTVSKKVSMDGLTPFTKRIRYFETAKFKGGSRFKNGDTLMARITPCLENGKTVLVDILQDGEVGHGSTEFIVLSGKKGKTTNDFVYYLAISPLLRTKAIKSMTGTSGRQRVQVDSLGEIDVASPPLLEQHRIAKILSDLDSKIELSQQMNKTLESITQAVFKHWFIDFEFPNEEGKPYKSSGGEMVPSEWGPIPKGWRKGHLGEIAESPRRGIQPDDIEQGTPYIGLEHMPRRSIALSEWATAEDVVSNKFQFYRGEILFGKLRPYFHKVGIAAVNGVCSTDILVIIPKSAEWYSFVLGQVSSYDFVGYADSVSTGTRMPRTSWQDMSCYEILLPEKSVARAFNDRVVQLLEKITADILYSHALMLISDLLLPRLMSGKIRVPVEVK